MEEFILLRPTSEYASQIIEYRQEFLDAGDSMDGTGPLRRFENPEEYIKICAEYEDPEKVPSHLVPATQFFFIRLIYRGFIYAAVCKNGLFASDIAVNAGNQHFVDADLLTEWKCHF